MAQQFEHATCLSLTMNCSDFFGIVLPQSEQRLVSIEIILAVIGSPETLSRKTVPGRIRGIMDT
jgi:hypothetical protein